MTVGEMLHNLLIGPLKMLFELIFSIANRFLSPGLCIVALSLCVNILVLPLYRRADAIQAEERETEARLAPGVNHIKKVFTGDQRFMTLQTYYRQNHYSPMHALKGALPLILELPFFIAAYQFLSGLEMLRNASFGPITNLGAPDELLKIGSITIHLLPVLMTVINLLSGAVYTKGATLKSKLQLYGMALVFLVLLYESPAGLTFYWTLNNLFSLIKNLLTKTLPHRKKTEQPAVPHFMKKSPAPAFFFLTAAFMALLTGALIPSAVMASSPSEFVNAGGTPHPFWYLVSSLLLATGSFVGWGGVYYLLGTPRVRKAMEAGAWILAGWMVINYMGFHRSFGVLSTGLRFEDLPSFTWAEKGINLAVLVVAGLVLLFAFARREKLARGICLTGVLAVAAMTGVNGARALPVIRTAIAAAQRENGEIRIPMSRDGKNVVVIMLDRAISSYIPAIFAEKPELEEQFDGFVWYSNTLSHGACTNFGTPGLFGGYEYTPWEMNRRTDERLAEKQDEALRVMPALFGREGYTVTVLDPPYAGTYGFVTDLSIYDGMENVRAYHALGIMGIEDNAGADEHQRFRNFFSYALCETAPRVIYGTLYNAGYYNELNAVSSQQTAVSLSVAEGIDAGFLAEYGVLTGLPDVTDIRETEQNTLLLLTSEITHTPRLLQTPDYEPMTHVNNVDYDAAHAERFLAGNQPLQVTQVSQMAHYHVNMAALIQLGKWMKLLREQDLYDNTRIILVSDHGSDMGTIENMILNEDGEEKDLMYFNAFLMVKDFNSRGEPREDDTFMTNADVPTLAAGNLISDPVNPFTGKKIDGEADRAAPQKVTTSLHWDTGTNNGFAFTKSRWYTVEKKVLDPDQWIYIGEY